MATNFPNSVDSFTNPSGTDSLNSPSHSGQHADANDAIEAIETYILDNPSGLVHINTVSFSTSSAESLNDVFSTNYDFYRILLTLTGSTTVVGVRYRLRVSGTDASGANYNRQLIEGNNTTATANRATGETSGPLGAIINTGPNILSADIVNPFIANRTVVYSAGWDPRNVIYAFGSEHTLSTSYTGITIYPESGTMTGSISVFAYRKS